MKRHGNARVVEALRAARADLGADAVVRSMAIAASRGWRGWFGMRDVRMTAVAEREVPFGRPVSDRRPSPGDRRRADTNPMREALVARPLMYGLASAILAERPSMHEHLS